ncbi:MAG: hypothetical protein P8R42_20565 [Candidatus Binatia bacterium]|nr:hypothetical protein [Candidatus Binatia bacterium]
MATILTFGRILLGLCFALNGGWWLYTWDLRAAYLDQIGAPSLVIVPVAAVYLVCGLVVAAGRAVRPATLPLMAVAGLIATLLHTDLGPGGIGEYPIDAHTQVNAKALLVQLALVGSLMLAFAAPRRGAPIDLRAVVLGRVLIGGYFVANALWQALFYETRFEHVQASGGNTNAIPVAIAVQIIFGMLIVAGRAVRGSTIPLAVVTIASTILVHGDLSPGAAYPPNLQIHQWFVKAAIVAGLILLFALGPVAAPAPTRRDLPAGDQNSKPPTPVD